MLVVRGRRVVLPAGEQAAAIHIDRGVIVDVRDYADVPEGDGVALVDAGDLVVLPGLVDSHVHINEPGRAEWEGFETATRAAAAGGVTTIVDMPLNSVPATLDVASLEAKRAAARGRIHVDVAFWGGIVPGNERHIAPLIEAGVRGFKCFMTPSGVDEFPSVSEADLRRALPVLARAAGRECPLLVHAEDPLALRHPAGPARVYATFLATRPVEAEVSAIRLIAALTGEYHVASHVVHVSSAEGAAAVAAAQAAGIAMSAETCPHYLTFADEDVPDGATAFKCAPPVRERRHRDALWHALSSGVCRLVASDHSPAPPALKAVETGDFIAAWGGIASLELSLAAVWTGACTRTFTTNHLARWMSSEPAVLSGLADRKGAIRTGCDADLVVWNPDQTSTVAGARLQQRHKLTPYEGRQLRGVVQQTFLRGVKVWDAGALVHPGQGRLL